jgi:glycerate dehydrogenase
LRRRQVDQGQGDFGDQNGKNCFITPHIAWATKEARVRLMRIAVGNLKGFIKGEIVNNVAE